MLELSLAVATAYAIALAAWPILHAWGRTAAVFATLSAIAVLLTPLLIPADRIVLRAMAAYLAVELMFKMLDYSRRQRCRDGDVVRLGEYLRFLIPFPTMLVVFGQRERRLPTDRPRTRDVLRVVSAAALFATGFGLVHFVSQFAVVRSCFPLDHAVKLMIFVLTVEALAQLLYGLERLAGFETTPIIRNVLVSRTVAEFWCRYNTRVHGWFEQNVFRPSGGRHAPARAVVLCFFVSAILHELMFAIATSRWDGYQFTFFMLQVPAVLVSRPLNRLASHGGLAGKVVAHGTAIAWMAVTSIFFFHGVDRVFPFFYASESWLP